MNGNILKCLLGCRIDKKFVSKSIRSLNLSNIGEKQSFSPILTPFMPKTPRSGPTIKGPGEGGK